MTAAGSPDLERRMADVVDRVGAWQSHNVHLGDGLWTISGDSYAPDLRLRRVLQLTADVTGRPLSELRVLDLACEEGLFGIELARHGAEVVGIEARAVHVERARFAAESAGLERYEVRCGDVREVSAERDGEFDVVLALGILYHLDTPDLFELVERLGAMCRRALIVDTHVATAPRATREYGGRSYSGAPYLEHRPASAAAEREANLRASIDNTESFWLTLPSLLNLLVDAGFTSVLQSVAPRAPGLPRDEVVLVALKGEPHVPSGAPREEPWPRLPERERAGVDPSQTARGRLRRLARRAVNRRKRA